MFSTCSKVTKYLSGFDRPWGIAGGWAIDLFIGKETRNHLDVEVAIFREDQHVLKNALPDWSFQKVVSGELLPWERGWLELPIHEIHGIHKQGFDRLEVLLNETKDGRWFFRRDPMISFPETTLFLQSTKGIPVLHPVIVLLYKAKSTREKDHVDFFTVKSLLNDEDKRWLKESLQLHVPGHEWICEL